MLFNFRLTPIENVQPWGSGNNLSLEWFGLTDGCYWLQVGDTELFRYREEALAMFGGNDYGCRPYVDYQVARLWADLLDLLPSILSPIPEALAKKLAPHNLLAWRAGIERWMESKENGLWEPAYEHATEWLRVRYLDYGYLVAGPIIWFWNDGTHIHIEWDNRQQHIDDVPIWTAQIGSWLLTVEAFLEEVRMFNSAFIDAMASRVEQVASGWDRPDVFVDVDRLILEQTNSSAQLEQSLRKPYREQPHDWSVILDAIALIEAETKTE